MDPVDRKKAPSHWATLQPRERPGALPPHPATVQRRAAPFGLPRGLPPHPATVQRRAAPFGEPSGLPPHPALGPGKPNGGREPSGRRVQMSSEEKSGSVSFYYDRLGLADLVTDEFRTN